MRIAVMFIWYAIRAVLRASAEVNANPASVLL